ncbi:MAG: hypothetical protein R8G66_20010 [Cytophagales bacterium]|nr:hypothetical protein [Cytophagales bacterium]
MNLQTLTNTSLSTRFIQRLEQVEGSYWMQYYRGSITYPVYSSIIAGGMACAIPHLDILFMNRVIGLGLSTPINETSLEQVIRFYEKAGSKRFFIQLPPQVITEEIIALMSQFGFSHRNNWTKLFRTVAPLEHGTNGQLSVRQIEERESDNYGQLIFMSFNWEDSRLATWLASTVGKRGYRHYIVSWEGRDIAAGALYVDGDMASMAFAGTLKAFRGHGAQQLLLKRRLQDAYDMGAKFITGETAEHLEEKPVVSYLNMKKSGFQTAYQRQNWLLKF